MGGLALIVPPPFKYAHENSVAILYIVIYEIIELSPDRHLPRRPRLVVPSKIVFNVLLRMPIFGDDSYLMHGRG